MKREQLEKIAYQRGFMLHSIAGYELNFIRVSDSLGLKLNHLTEDFKLYYKADLVTTLETGMANPFSKEQPYTRLEKKMVEYISKLRVEVI